MNRFGFAVFVHLLAFGFLREQDPEGTVTLTISQGTLRGKIVTSPVTGQKYYSFLGIPYAKPPLGSLRFKGPRAPESWTGVRDATAEGALCVQSGTGSEDCLFLNVVTPEVMRGILEILWCRNMHKNVTKLRANSSVKNSGVHNSCPQLPDRLSSGKLRPVMVWVHGGGYQTGFGSLAHYGPDYLLARDVVFVSINYRLGILGFLSLEDSDAPGNAGLKDQVAALRWVKANVHKFGGDPSSVTLFGESAGGSAVHHQVLSPLSQGLFHRAISESGAAMNPSAFFKSTRDRAFRLGKFLGLETTNSQHLVDFFRNFTADKLVASQNKGLTEEESQKPIAAAFIPTTEYSVEGEEMFLVASPWEMTKKGHFKKIPYITGVNKDEGLLAYMGCRDSTCLNGVDRDFERVLPLNLGLQKGSEQSKRIAAQVRQFYFGDKNVSTETAQNYIDLQTDAMYCYGCHYVVNHSIQHQVRNVYNYQFVYEGKLGSGAHSNIAQVHGAAVTERLAFSHPAKAGRVQCPAASLPDIRMWESCRTMPLVGGFSRGSPVSPALLFWRFSIVTIINLICSQDLAVKSRRNLWTHSQSTAHMLLLRVCHQISYPFDYFVCGIVKNMVYETGGVGHGDELNYIFYQEQHGQLQENSTDMKVVNTMVTMWTNFAKTGNPSISDQLLWKDATQSHHYYLKINATPSLQEDLNKERMALWDGIYTSLGFESTSMIRLAIRLHVAAKVEELDDAFAGALPSIAEDPGNSGKHTGASVEETVDMAEDDEDKT
ncbi:hypothetical protein PR048_003295 [Dryococelus australis]|uniref:Carboxylesterase type B domain-containing protein n=1 Tax=Dryococelus australis TaxID=614101 RepID=A0ABQ9IN65_9NEOP|nr:hypothetical protein PR048_003295 [Dryococelus australis]